MVEEQDNIIKEEENEAVDDNNSLPAIMPSLLPIKIKLKFGDLGRKMLFVAAVLLLLVKTLEATC